MIFVRYMECIQGRKHRADRAGYCSFCQQKISEAEKPLEPIRPKRWSQEAIDKSLFNKLKIGSVLKMKDSQLESKEKVTLNEFL